MIFCINNMCNSTPEQTTGTIEGYPFTNVLSDTLQDKFFFQDFRFTKDKNNTLFSNTSLRWFGLLGITTDSTLTVVFSPTVGGNLTYTYTQQQLLENDTILLEVPTNITLSYIRVYIASGIASISHCYIGNPLILPDPSFGSLPSLVTNDLVSKGLNGKTFTYEGHVTRKQGFTINVASYVKYKEFISFYNDGNLRRKPFLFAQTEDDTELFQPYFATLDIDPNFTGRNIANKYTWDFSVTEAF